MGMVQKQQSVKLPLSREARVNCTIYCLVKSTCLWTKLETFHFCFHVHKAK
ncbi:hypothetical protein I79_018488 [Cricetulus griseus]|uniref:Uncharacterized protein n=1 Tax=Cricetulus griseus TaxID=10029 RepID=G3I4V1_CRIGR|nr:hypothetical protein I79_018488 [Cricetulus griseus]